MPNINEVRVCKNHRDERETQLIDTWAFNGAEYWCPYCDYIGGFLGAGERVPQTEHLKLQHEEDVAYTKEYLKAETTLICKGMKIDGVMTPRKDFPPEIIENAKAVIAAYVPLKEKEESKK